MLISIHAPQWGATASQCAAFAGAEISIHAPQWGATSANHSSRRPIRYFNPRTPVGCDEVLLALGRDLRRISIHAPQWGATRYDGSGGRPRHFNPRTPVGCDVAQMVENGATVKISIHAPQWGATSRRRTGPASTRNFNPRTPVGCDRFHLHPVNRAGYGFQSTHPSGVRPGAWRVHAQRGGISIHAPQWGATRRCAWTWTRSTNFNPRTPVGCDAGHRTVGPAGRDFNPRTPVGCDLAIVAVIAVLVIFQSTHPSGVRPREWA